MNNKLAIVIPAYKSTFFRQALESIAKQSCQDFNLYIGDDASPEDLAAIVNEFKYNSNIIYRRFDVNYGGKDLVSHWNRCISMTNSEEWIWLFSDDDVMAANCVELFYKNLKIYDKQKIFHINVKVINQHNKLLYDCTTFPEKITSSELFAGKVKLRLVSTVVEYIFRRDLFESKGGFENYDLAWGSDDATWIKLNGNEQILTIQDCNIFWRYSTENISSSLSDPSIVTRKIEANIEYLNWIKLFFRENNIEDCTSDIDKLKWMLQTVKNSSLSIIEQINLSLLISKKAMLKENSLIWGIAYILFSRAKNLLTLKN